MRHGKEITKDTIKCRAKGYNDLVTVVGAMPEVHVGAVLTLTGMWKMAAKYGRQFSIETFEETLPATVFGIEKYLGSGLIKGIGPKFAKRIVQAFGNVSKHFTPLSGTCARLRGVFCFLCLVVSNAGLLNYAYYSLGNRTRRFCSTAFFASTSCFSSLISGLASSSR